MMVLSSEKNPVVQTRCDKLGIECIQNIQNKLPALMNWLNQNSINPAQTVYVGNDVNDLGCLQFVGCGVATKDAHTDAKSAADLVLNKTGGNGALREIAELIIQKLESRNQ